MSVLITRDSRVHVVGDSISNPIGPNGGWQLSPGGLRDRLAGDFFWHDTRTVPPTPVPVPIPMTSFGVNGQSIAGLDTNFATEVAPFDPTLLVIEIGINDAAASTPSVDFTASYLSVINKALALNPSMNFALGSCLCDGELWVAGPTWGGNPFDSEILRIDGLIQSLSTSLLGSGVPTIYLDWRQRLLLIEQAINSPPPGSSGGRATIDGIHPTTEVELMMADVMLEQCVLR